MFTSSANTASTSAPVTPAMHVTREDIELLVREPSVTVRTRITEKIATGFNTGLMSEKEHTLATEIFRLLLKDTELRVRATMAEHLKHNMQVPHDIIWALANDHADVSSSVLQYSHVLTEDDLLAIVRATREHPKLRAVAKRETLSRELAHALVEKRNEEVTRLVVGNNGAALSETTMELVLEEFSRDNTMLSELVLRGGLPYRFAEKLFAEVSDSLKKQLTRKYRLSKVVAEDAAAAARETAVLQFISPWMSQTEINQMIDQMDRNGRLTDSVMIRSLCIGDLRFFEAAVAKRVGIPVSNTRILMLDPGPLGFKALYASLGLPADFYEAVRTMLQLALAETQYGTYRTTDFCAKMVGRIVGGGYNKTVPHMATLMAMIGATMQPAAPTMH